MSQPPDRVTTGQRLKMLAGKIPTWGWVAIILGILAIIGYSRGDSDGDVDPGVEDGCVSFRSASTDFADGVLTYEEYRAESQEIYDESIGDNEEVIHQQSREVLAALTTLDDERLARAGEALSDTCSSFGL